MVLCDEVPLTRASKEVGICHETLKKYIDSCRGLSRREISQIEVFPIGCAPFLSADSIEILRLFFLTMDINGFLMGQKTFESYVKKLHSIEYNMDESDVVTPDPKTIRKYKKEVGMPLHSVCDGPGVDALRETKATSKYLCGYFDKLEEVIIKHQISAKNM